MDDSVKQLDDLKADPKNPRTLDRHDAEALSRSMTAFGDLGCIVFNIQTQQLVGGHQRVEMMKKLPHPHRVLITHRVEPADENGTVALGYIYIGNKAFAYREVDWDLPTQRAANIAANRISGEFDLDLLSEIDNELLALENGDALIRLSGQTDDEVKNLLKSAGVEEHEQPKGDGAEHMSVRLSPEQKETIDEALGNAKTKIDNSQVASSSYDGLALELICRIYLDHLHTTNDASQNEAPIAE